MKFLLSAVVAVLLCGCQSINQQDGTALVQGVQTLESEYLALSEGFEAITLKSMGDSAKKEILLARIRESRRNFGMVAQQLVQTTSTMMRVNYEGLYNAMAQTWWQIKYPGQQPPIYAEVTVP